MVNTFLISLGWFDLVQNIGIVWCNMLWNTIKHCHRPSVYFSISRIMLNFLVKGISSCLCVIIVRNYFWFVCHLVPRNYHGVKLTKVAQILISLDTRTLYSPFLYKQTYLSQDLFCINEVKPGEANFFGLPLQFPVLKELFK